MSQTGTQSNLTAFAFALAGLAALGLIVFGWLQFADTIYLTRLTAFATGCI